MIKWAKKELQNLDRKTTKFMNIYRAFHTKGEKNTLYMKRRKSGSGMISEEMQNMKVLRKVVKGYLKQFLKKKYQMRAKRK